MPNFDFLAQPSLPRPGVTVDDAAAIAAEHWGLTGRVTELGSQQDRNFLIDTGRGRTVLKLANPVFSAEELQAQNAAMAVLAGSPVRVPEVIPASDGRDLVAVEVRGVALLARMLGYLDGEPLTGVARPTAEQLRTLGSLAGAVAAGLRALRHPGLARTTQWDARVAGEVVDLLLGHVADPAKRRVVREATEAALARLEPVRGRLRVQAIHGDVTDDNVVLGGAGAGADGGAGADAGAGVIDFGDVSDGWLVAELAATVTSALHHVPTDPLAVLDVVDAFAAEAPLDDADLTALWPLVVLRGAVLVVSGEQQVALDGDNRYADENRAHEWLAFDLARRIPFDEVEAVLRRRSERAAAASTAAAASDAPTTRVTPTTPTAPVRVAAPLVPLATEQRHLADLSVTSHALDAGRWLDADAETSVLAAVCREHGHAVSRYAEQRLTRAAIDRDAASATRALSVSLDAPGGVDVHAPFAGDLALVDGSWRLRGDDTDLWLDGLSRPLTTARVAAGETIGAAVTLTVQLSRVRGRRPPAFVTPCIPRPLWEDIAPDPSGLFGFELAAAESDPERALARRDDTFARVQEHYFARPPLIERGWRHHLVDSEGQTYLDMVNNVTAVGHAHPRLVAAVRDQWALLNTNSRFHYEGLARFTERLAALAPDALDTVFLVNSGSEAVDLALRLAQTHTGRRTVLAVTEAYHGWTVGSDAVSSSLGDNPRALETRPDWVRLVASPHTFRGRHRGARSAPAYLAELDADLAELDRTGTAIAGFIAEPVFGNAGGVMLPDGYLRGVYERIRARGGVCIADEVQVGYGRLGHHFWGVEQQGVVPDIITIAKAMGNGHPLGAVITTAAIAESFAAEGSFFSSAGGSPVSAAVGLTVLDIMRDESLQRNAAEVGDHLAARLRELAGRHALIGAVHGLGLYLGVELVRDRETLEPATEEAAAICERMLAEGCVVQPTGDHKNVLKIKPPLGITVASADRFVDAMDLVLATL